MKTAYVVTSGSYSDYHILKIFSNKPAAEDYIKWHKYCNKEIEEYTVDEVEEFEKHYVVAIDCTSTDKEILEQKTTVEYDNHSLIPINYYTQPYKLDKLFQFRLVRSIPFDKYTEEEATKRCEKILYDFIGICRAHRAEGATETEIQEALCEEQRENASKYLID